ncbi:MAG TPA: LAGLIDADG family homing endonuclease [Candidatus Saccharimonadales bacterium]|nr:LAGLIDADG family homing endonuclease [Candidatus Saccharimonadales bacterium]
MRWSADLAYVVGLIASDGCLSKDGRHIDFTSKDLDQVETFARILNLKNKIALKSRGHSSEKIYYHIQFGNVKFYKFLLQIGLTPHKSKTISTLKIPNKYFVDFLRGCFDGDGHTYSYWDPRWRSSFMLYFGLTSASNEFLKWIKERIKKLYDINGQIGTTNRAYKLIYAKGASINLIDKIYYKDGLPYLLRKKYKINASLSIINKRAEVPELVDGLD